MFSRILSPCNLVLLIVTLHSQFSYNHGAEGTWWSQVSEGYPKYEETTTLLREMESKYPDIVKIYSAGKSVEGREMWVAQLANDVKNPRPLLRPMVKQVANMHGDETVGRSLLLMLVVDIVQKYKSNDPRIVKLLNTTDIHLMPSVNPDGFEVAEGGCSPNPDTTGRRNKNEVDLNRNFPDQFEISDENDPSFYEDREPETLNMMKYIMNHPFVLSTNLHGGATVASYPFDSVPFYVENRRNYEGYGIPSLAPDDKVFKTLSLQYASNHKTMSATNKPNDPYCIRGDFRNGVTNGAAWYNVRGGMQDFNYVQSNCFEITVELTCCKYPPKTDLITEWQNNKESLYQFMEAVHMGCKGLVKTEDGSAINNAEIIVQGIHKRIQTTENGEYWRLLVPGTYRVRAYADGYEPSRVQRIHIVHGKTEIVNFTLIPIAGET